MSIDVDEVLVRELNAFFKQHGLHVTRLESYADDYDIGITNISMKVRHVDVVPQ